MERARPESMPVVLPWVSPVVVEKNWKLEAV